VARLATLLLVSLTSLAPGPARAIPPAGSPPVRPAPEPAEGPSGASGEVELSVGVRAEQSPVARDTTGFLTLGVPLERFDVPRRVVLSRAADDPDAARSPASDEPVLAEPTRARRPDGAPSAAALLGAPELSVLARGAVAAARRNDRTDHHERELDSLAARSRWSALLPELRLRAARTRDESLRLTPTTDDPYRFTLAGGDALVVEGAASFRLGRLVFANDELAVERLRLERARSAERRAARVVERLLAWHGAASRLASPEREALESAEVERLVRERLDAEIELDVLTGGWFRAELGRLTNRAAQSRRTGTEPPRRKAPGGAPALSATSSGPCLPKHETASPTFCGASTR
jgi:hypothetical protein